MNVPTVLLRMKLTIRKTTSTKLNTKLIIDDIIRKMVDVSTCGNTAKPITYVNSSTNHLKALKIPSPVLAEVSKIDHLNGKS